MRQIKMKTLACGPVHGVLRVGKEYEVADDFAEKLVNAKSAVYVGKPTPVAVKPPIDVPLEPVVETAAVEPVTEKAVKPPARKRKTKSGRFGR